MDMLEGKFVLVGWYVAKMLCFSLWKLSNSFGCDDLKKCLQCNVYFASLAAFSDK